MTINKTNLQKRLSKVAFEVTQNAKQKDLLQENILIFLKKDISMYCCNKDLFDSDKNLNQILDGLVSLKL